MHTTQFEDFNVYVLPGVFNLFGFEYVVERARISQKIDARIIRSCSLYE